MILTYILSIVLSIVYGVVIVYFADEISGLRWFAFEQARSVNEIASIVSEAFNLFYVLVFCFTFKYIKRTTSLVISIIGLSIVGIAFLFNLAAIMNGFWFDHLGIFLIFMTPVLLAFSIVNLVQAVIYNKRSVVNQKTIDDL